MGIRYRKLACLVVCEECKQRFFVVLPYHHVNVCRYYAECPECHRLQEVTDLPANRLSNAKCVCTDVQPYDPHQSVENAYHERAVQHYREQLALATAHLHNLQTAAQHVICSWKKHWNQDVFREPIQELRLRLRDIRQHPLHVAKEVP